MTNGDAIAALTDGPEGRRRRATVKLTLVEGPSRQARTRRSSTRAARSRAATLKAAASKAALERIRELGAPKGTKTAEGFLFPATYTLHGRRHRQRARQAAARRVRGELQARRHELRQEEEPHALRRADHRVDDRARGAAGQGARARLGGHLQPAQAGYAARDRRDDPLLRRTTGSARSASPSSTSRRAVQHARSTAALPPTPIGNPGLASLKAAAQALRTRTYLFYVRKPGKSGEHAFSSHRRAVRARPSQRYQASRDGK